MSKTNIEKIEFWLDESQKEIIRTKDLKAEKKTFITVHFLNALEILEDADSSAEYLSMRNKIITFLNELKSVTSEDKRNFLEYFRKADENSKENLQSKVKKIK